MAALSIDPEPASGNVEFDSQALLERIEGDRNLLKELIGIFLDDIPGLIFELGDGIMQGNAGVVEKTAHAIRGSCAMMSVQGLEKLTHQLEIMGKTGKLAGADAEYQRVVASFDDIRRIMKSLLESMTP